ncbi:MAG TPA: metalloregulator ArsR/SmtB family transcription factor [Candidatus Limnocylindrales bacterium]|nr:metalloregulator ArsR/SmtB family transcription factor [Candidatus Limnocylindrales bacterium]
MNDRRGDEGRQFVNQPLQRFKADYFKALAHPTRIQILEVLRRGERSVGEIQRALDQEGSTVSQQLAVLRMKNLVDTRKDGNVIFYRLRDPLVGELLDVARQIFDSHVTELRALIEPDSPPRPTPARRRGLATGRRAAAGGTTSPR